MTHATLLGRPIADQPQAWTGPSTAGTCTEPGASRGMLSAPGSNLESLTCLSCGEVPAWAWWFTAKPALPDDVITDWLAANVPHCQCGASGAAVLAEVAA